MVNGVLFDDAYRFLSEEGCIPWNPRYQVPQLVINFYSPAYFHVIEIYGSFQTLCNIFLPLRL